jgi:hypothetical protein
MLRKNLHYYSKRLLKQTLKIDKVTAKIDNYFQGSFQKCTNVRFTDEALKVFRGARGISIETSQDINVVVDQMYAFIERWENVRDIDKKTLKFAKRLHHELVQFASYVAETPLEMMTDIKNYILGERL